MLHLSWWLFPDYGGIQEKFSLCKTPSSPEDIYQLQGLLRNAFTLMAMLDYPYSTTFVSSLPANPVKVQTLHMIDDWWRSLQKVSPAFFFRWPVRPCWEVLSCW